MAESKVKRENFIALQGWMVTDLQLKGNELIIYACIYGFSQEENSYFNGSLQYLADWTNSTKQGVLKCLKSLIEKGLLEKKESVVNGIKFCEYRVTKFNGIKQSLTPLNKVEQGIKQSLTGGIKQSLTNNIELDNKEYNIENIYTPVISYLNEKAKTNYKATSKKTQSCIKARVAEGFTLEDFKTVINKKCAEWIGTEFEQYLRPETLFGTKFENYLNAKSIRKNPTQSTNTGYAQNANMNDLDDLWG